MSQMDCNISSGKAENNKEILLCIEQKKKFVCSSTNVSNKKVWITRYSPIKNTSESISMMIFIARPDILPINASFTTEKDKNKITLEMICNNISIPMEISNLEEDGRNSDTHQHMCEPKGNLFDFFSVTVHESDDIPIEIIKYSDNQLLQIDVASKTTEEDTDPNCCFSQVEHGNQTICQNNKCAKYMDQVDECFYSSDCLWQCKHCSVEFQSEYKVKRHRPQPMPEENYEPKITYKIIQDLCKKKNLAAKIKEIKTKLVKKKHLKKLDNSTFPKKEPDVSEVSLSNQMLYEITNKEPGMCKLSCKTKQEEISCETKSESSFLQQNIHLLLNLSNNNFSSQKDFDILENDSKELQQANDIQTALQDLFTTAIKVPESFFDCWFEDVQKYKMVCYFNGCNQSFNCPKLLIKHLASCSFGNKELWKMLGSKIVFCIECNESFKLKKYGIHYSALHGLLLLYLKSLDKVKKLRCKNYTCQKVMKTICSCVEHYRKCKYLWECNKCQTVCDSKKSVKLHKKTGCNLVFSNNESDRCKYVSTYKSSNLLNEVSINKKFDVLAQDSTELTNINKSNIFKSEQHNENNEDHFESYIQHIKVDKRHIKNNREQIENIEQKIEIDGQHIKDNGQHFKNDEQHIKINDQHIENNEQEIENKKQHIENNEQHIKSNEQHIKINVQPIKNNERHIKINDQYVENNEKQIESNKQRSENSVQNIENYKQHIKNTREQIENNEHKVENNEQHIDNNEKHIEHNEQYIKINELPITNEEQHIKINKQHNQINEKHIKVQENLLDNHVDYLVNENNHFNSHNNHLFNRDNLTNHLNYLISKQDYTLKHLGAAFERCVFHEYNENVDDESVNFIDFKVESIQEQSKHDSSSVVPIQQELLEESSINFQTASIHGIVRQEKNLFQEKSLTGKKEKKLSVETKQEVLSFSQQNIDLLLNLSNNNFSSQKDLIKEDGSNEFQEANDIQTALKDLFTTAIQIPQENSNKFLQEELSCGSKHIKVHSGKKRKILFLGTKQKELHRGTKRKKLSCGTKQKKLSCAKKSEELSCGAKQKKLLCGSKQGELSSSQQNISLLLNLSNNNFSLQKDSSQENGSDEFQQANDIQTALQDLFTTAIQVPQHENGETALQDTFSCGTKHIELQCGKKRKKLTCGSKQKELQCVTKHKKLFCEAKQGELSSLQQSTPILLNLSNNNFSSQKDSSINDSNEFQEANDIQTALQDLFTIAIKTPKSFFDCWFEDVQKYKMVCYFNGCNQSFNYPKLLIKHLANCNCGNNELWKMLGSKIVFCIECNESFKLKNYGIHYSASHDLLLSYLKSLKKVNKPRCMNYACETIMKTICSCVEHYRRCKYLWKCNKCQTVCDSKKGVKLHKKTCCGSKVFSNKESDRCEHVSAYTDSNQLYEVSISEKSNVLAQDSTELTNINKSNSFKHEHHIENNEQHIENDEQYIENNEQHIENDEQHIENNEHHIENNEQHIENDEQYIENNEQHIENDEQHIENNEHHIENNKQNIENTKQDIKNSEKHIKTNKQHKKNNKQHIEDNEQHFQIYEHHIKSIRVQIENNKPHIESNVKHIENNELLNENDEQHIKNSREKIENHEQKIENNVKQIKNNEKHIENKEQNIGNSEQHIENNEQHIENNEQHIANNEQHIGNKELYIEINKQHIKSSKELIENYEQHIESNKENIRKSEQHIENNEQCIKSNEQNIENNGQHVQKNKLYIEIDEQHIKSNEVLIEISREQIENNKQKIESNEQNIENNKQHFENNEQHIESNEQHIENNEQKTKKSREQIENDKQLIEMNKQNIENNEQNIENNEQLKKNNEQYIGNNEQHFKIDKQPIKNIREQIENSKQQVESNEQHIECNEQLIERNEQHIECNKQHIENDDRHIKNSEELIENNEHDTENNKQHIKNEQHNKNKEKYIIIDEQLIKNSEEHCNNALFIENNEQCIENNEQHIKNNKSHIENQDNHLVNQDDYLLDQDTHLSNQNIHFGNKENHLDNLVNCFDYLISNNDYSLKHLGAVFERCKVHECNIYENVDDESFNFVDFKIESVGKKFDFKKQKGDTSSVSSSIQELSEERRISSQINDILGLKNNENHLSKELSFETKQNELTCGVKCKDISCGTKHQELFCTTQQKELSSLQQNIHLLLNLSNNNFSSQKDTSLNDDSEEFQDIDDIQNALQDLFTTSIKTPKSFFDCWYEDVQKYKMVCYFNGCNQSFNCPKLLIKHLANCSCGNNELWKMLGSKIVLCIECNESFKLKKYGKHYSALHELLLSYLKSLNKVNKPRCKNYTCETIMKTICSCVEHYRKCKYLWKCNKCQTVCGSEKIVKLHKKTCCGPD